MLPKWVTNVTGQTKQGPASSPYSQPPPKFNNPGTPAAPVTGDAGVDALLAGRPNYQGITDKSGNLYDNFKIKGNPSQSDWLSGKIGDVNDSGVNSNIGQANTDLAGLHQMAQSSGLSPYAQAQMKQLDLSRSANANAASGAAQGAMSYSMDNAAMRGGLSGGAAERMGTQGATNAANAMQGVYGQDAAARAGVAAGDASFKQNLYSQLPGMDMGVAGQENAIGMGQVGTELGQKNLEGGQNIGVQEFNTGNAVNDIYQQNPYNMGVWGKGADVYAGVQSANAMNNLANKPQAGLFGGGGFLGTGVSGPAEQANGWGGAFGNLFQSTGPQASYNNFGGR